MPGKINLYALGQGGVNVVKSPIQMADDECRSAQNAIYSPDAEGGLRKRGALVKLNASALNSGASILAAHNVALPNPFNTATLTTKYMYWGGGEDLVSSNWVRTADGTTWADVSAPRDPWPGLFDSSNYVAARAAMPVLTPGYFLYWSSRRQLSKWDGTADVDVVLAPLAPGADATSQAQASCVHNGSIYFSVIDPVNTTSRVYKLDAITGQITNVGGVISVADAVVLCLCSFNGQLFAGVVDYGQATAANRRIWRINPDTETSWTVDSAALAGWPISMVPFQGSLYIGTGAIAAVTPRVYRRTASAVYSQVAAGVGLTGAGGTLYRVSNTLLANIDHEIYSTTDGTAWASEVNYATLVGQAVVSGGPMAFGSNLYWPLREAPAESDSFVIKRTSGAVWSVVLDNAQSDGSCFLTQLGLL